MTGTSYQGSVPKFANTVVSSGAINSLIKEQNGSNGGHPPLSNYQRQKRIFKFVVDFGGQMH